MFSLELPFFPNISKENRIFLTQFIELGIFVHFLLMMKKFGILITTSDSPIYAATSDSMYPGIKPGDVLLVSWDYTYPIPGDIIVYKKENDVIPVIHRVIAVQPLENGDYNLLTKGDYNPNNDRGLYNGKLWINKKNVLGRVKFYIPYIALPIVLIHKYSLGKYILLILISISVIKGFS